ncbi:hypothetical protein BDZ88DRAFT_426534 [Geranomyces variabilis]|nr:hypothetical protein BDZ88DRAFT_426534 [Geranomyces variabilis]
MSSETGFKPRLVTSFLFFFCPGLEQNPALALFHSVQVPASCPRSLPLCPSALIALLSIATAPLDLVAWESLHLHRLCSGKPVAADRRHRLRLRRCFRCPLCWVRILGIHGQIALNNRRSIVPYLSAAAFHSACTDSRGSLLKSLRGQTLQRH